MCLCVPYAVHVSRVSCAVHANFFPPHPPSAVRSFAANGMEMLVACSFSKNFGLYGERVGAVHAVVSEPALCENVASQLRAASRVLYRYVACGCACMLCV